MYITPKREQVIRGIEAYGSMQAMIGALMLEHGGLLSEREFDAYFGYGRHLPFLPIAPMTGDTFILSIGGAQQQYLHLAQLMISAGLIDAHTGEDGLVYYTFFE